MSAADDERLRRQVYELTTSDLARLIASLSVQFWIDRLVTPVSPSLKDGT